MGRRWFKVGRGLKRGSVHRLVDVYLYADTSCACRNRIGAGSER
jgi:hypothetical protein